MDSLFINESDLNKLRAIGYGVESIVYNAPKGLLYKVYNSKEVLYKEFSHMSKEEIDRLYSLDNIMKAVKRRNEITLTTLPLAPLFVDEEFRGCVLKKHRLSRPIQSIVMLPKKEQIVILKRLLSAIKELTDHAIYPRDLCTNEISGRSHSNVLVDMRHRPQIIDLEGNSTIYADRKDSGLEYLTYLSVSSLMMDILYEIDPNQERDIYDLDYDARIITESGVSTPVADKLLYGESDYETLHQLLYK